MWNWIKNLFKKKKPQKSNVTTWRDIKYFSPHEFKHVEKMSISHIKKLDFFRESLNTPVIITSSYREGDKSTHGQGIATDVMFTALSYESLLNAYLEAERHDFGGIGIYVDWKLNNKLKGGLHLDSRMKVKGRGARWLSYYSESEKKQKYVALSFETLKQHYFEKIV